MFLYKHYKNKKIGTFVYVKSSVTAPEGRPDIPKDKPLKYGTYKYKIYHPTFPHESTADQFFDPIQWESYYQLGQYIAADVLGIKDLAKYIDGPRPEFDNDQLIEHFDNQKALFATEEEPTPEKRIDEPAPKVKSRSMPSRAFDPPTPAPTAEEKVEVVDKDVNYKI